MKMKENLVPVFSLLCVSSLIEELRQLRGLPTASLSAHHYHRVGPNGLHDRMLL